MILIPLEKICRALVPLSGLRPTPYRVFLLLLFLVTARIPLGTPYGGVASDGVLRLQDLNRGT